jgi:RNA polymerase sigma factor (sigma-70 family)
MDVTSASPLPSPDHAPELSLERVRVPAASPGAGSPGAEIERLLSRFGDVARRAGASHGLSGDEIDEVLQEVRIRLWRQGADEDKLRTLTPAYIYRTAASAALDMLRRRRARREHLHGEVPYTLGGGAAADLPMASAELVSEIEGAINQIASSRRPVVRMYLAGYSREEIATVMGWSEAKARNLLYRGLDDLRQRLLAKGIRP